ncbi:unnamed protein product [Cuscuta europaea]|uniref:Uncharacterized protein n=1 Tax=Cuscuta europaea TaxID=41803 RepID=A0A9P0YLH1_CUSEU|nr:unnamed protein product [Cuscuta europaea]
MYTHFGPGLKEPEVNKTATFSRKFQTRDLLYEIESATNSTGPFLNMYTLIHIYRHAHMYISMDHSIGEGIVFPTEEHDDAASKNVQPGLVLLRHGETPFPEAGFPAASPAVRIR